jgi:hypothetical protein
VECCPDVVVEFQDGESNQGQFSFWGRKQGRQSKSLLGVFNKPTHANYSSATQSHNPFTESTQTPKANIFMQEIYKCRLNTYCCQSLSWLILTSLTFKSYFTLLSDKDRLPVNYSWIKSPWKFERHPLIIPSVLFCFNITNILIKRGRKFIYTPNFILNHSILS